MGYPCFTLDRNKFAYFVTYAQNNCHYQLKFSLYLFLRQSVTAYSHKLGINIIMSYG